MALFDNLNKKASLKALKMPPSLEAECNGILLKINLPFSVLNDHHIHQTINQLRLKSYREQKNIIENK